MQLSYRGRIIAYNITIFLTIFVFVLFCLVQGSIYHAVVTARYDLAAMSQDASLYIEEELKTIGDSSITASYQKHAASLSHQIAETEGAQTLLFSPEGTLLTNSSDAYSPDFSRELAAMPDSGQPVLTLTENEGVPAIRYLASVDADGQTLGYVGFYYSLERMNSQLNTMLLYYLLGGLLGFPIVIIATLSFSNHFVKPVRDLTRIAEEITKGNYNVQIHYRRQDEIGALTSVFNTMTQNVNSAIDQLGMERNRLAGVLASLDDGLLALDKDGNVITSNSYIKTYFNVSNPKTIYDFQFQSFLRDIFDDLKSGREHISTEVDCNDRTLLIIGSPVHNAGFEENYLMIIRNITPDIQLQKEQQKFISSVSHELRTPLTTIIGYTDMLTRRQVQDGEILNRSLTTINREGKRLLRLVDDLLNVNRLEHMEFDFKKTNVDLHTLLNDVVEQMQIKSQQKEIVINYKSDESLPEILGDYDRLQQLFINIIHNAIKYSDVGDIIDVVSTREDDNVVVSVRDYGVGISDLEQKKIFNAFYRVEEDRARSEGEGGAGLGLFLVKQIVEKHHGTLSIESILGEGTNIIVSLPVLEKTVKEGVQDE